MSHFCSHCLVHSMTKTSLTLLMILLMLMMTLVTIRLVMMMGRNAMLVAITLLMTMMMQRRMIIAVQSWYGGGVGVVVMWLSFSRSSVSSHRPLLLRTGTPFSRFL